MRAADWNDALMADHRAYLHRENGRQAFDRMVAIADALPDYDCSAAWHGRIRDFRYVDPASGEWTVRVATRTDADAVCVNSCCGLRLPSAPTRGSDPAAKA